MNCANYSIDSLLVKTGHKFNFKFNQHCLNTLGLVITNRAGDITLPGKSSLILPCRFPLSCCLTTWPLHMQMQTKPLLPVSLRQPPQTHSLRLSLSASHTLPPRGHSAQTGTEPDLLCHTGLAKCSLSLSTLQIPRTSFHQNACGPPLLLSPSLFCTTAEIHTLKVCPPTSEKYNATTTSAGERMKHSHI